MESQLAELSKSIRTARYDVVFPSRAFEKKFDKFLSRVPKPDQQLIAGIIERLADDPTPRADTFKFLKVPIWVSQCLAQYRARIGDYRIFYDVDWEGKKVILLALKRKDEATYKG